MARRSRNRNRSSGVRSIALVALVLVVLAGGWYWKRTSHDTAGVAPPIDTSSTREHGDRHESELALPPAESTRLGDAAPQGNMPAPVPATPPTNSALPGFLPPEAAATLQSIARGGPFPHPQDGSVFANRERRLPSQPRGYYHEYTVDTPGARNRGARRIVTGGQPPSEYYYTGDHYETFQRFDVPAQVQR